MQSELLSHINALFSGKGLRRFEAVFTTIDSPDGSGKKSLFSEKFKERFARKTDSIDDTGTKEHRPDGKSRTRGINLTWISNMDLKLNFKGSNSPDIPPPVPARHFSTDNTDDLPPPIPERKCSLDSGIDEGFQRPVHHPPPPPLPADLFPSPTEEKTIHLPTRSSPHQLKHASKLGLTPSASLVVNGTPSQKDSLQQSVYTDVPDDDLDLPPPPARRLPPPPPSKIKTTSAVSTLIPLPAPISTAGTKSPKLKGFSRLMLPAIPVADTELTHNNEFLPSTPPFTPPPPPPPPLLLQTTVKNIATNDSPMSNASGCYSDKLPETLPETLPVVKEIKNYKELPQLPDKPSKKSTLASEPTFGLKKHPPKPPTSNGISRNKTKIPSYNQKQKLLPPGPETSIIVPPKPEFSSRTNHPNKSRPLPTIPSVLTGKKTAPSKANSGRGGGEVFDPRDEDGDIYDVMDSTDM